MARVSIDTHTQIHSTTHFSHTHHTYTNADGGRPFFYFLGAFFNAHALFLLGRYDPIIDTTHFCDTLILSFLALFLTFYNATNVVFASALHFFLPVHLSLLDMATRQAYLRLFGVRDAAPLSSLYGPAFLSFLSCFSSVVFSLFHAL